MNLEISIGISNETIREMTVVEKIEEFLREQRLRWFGCIERMDDKRALRKAKYFVFDCLREAHLRRGRS